MKIRINLKALSTNKQWQGRRFKTKEYEQYESDMLWHLKGVKYNISSWYIIKFDFFLHNYANTDLSNLIKSTEDIIVKAGMVKDDRYCKRMEIEKHKSETDYFTFEIEEYAGI